MRGPRPWRTDRAQALRSRETSAESRLWYNLRDRQFSGFKFIRQCPVGPYFVDFLCRSERVAVEIDGGTHGTNDQLAEDRRRETYLRARGLRIFRTSNVDIYDNIEGVLDSLLAFMRNEAP